MKQFMTDMIHMTEGEKLIAYWWLWLLIIAGAIAIQYAAYKRVGGKKHE